MSELTPAQDQIRTLLLASIGLVTVICAVILIMLIIASWKIFKKFGEPGWKALIPIYNVYVMCKYTWNAKAFWRFLIVTVCTFIVCNIDVTGFGLSDSPKSILTLCLLLLTIVGFVWQAVMSVKINFYISNAFGHGLPYGFGLWLLPGLFHLILGFGKSEYTKKQ